MFSFEGCYKFIEICDECFIENSSIVVLKFRVYSL